jgi:hypothetical protein
MTTTKSKAKRHADWQKLNRRRHNPNMRPLTKKWDAEAIRLLKQNPNYA